MNVEGSTIATKIVNLGLNKKSIIDSNIVMVGDGSQSGSLSEISLKQSNQELEEESNTLQDIVDKMASILFKMEKIILSERGICALEAFHYGEKEKPAPLFHTWSTQQFGKRKKCSPMLKHLYNQHWCPPGMRALPILFSLYTNDCIAKDPSVKLLKFADDTTVIDLIRDDDESAYRREVEQLAVWCSQNNLELNTLKTVEMIVDSRRNTPTLTPLTILNSTVAAVGHSGSWALPSHRTRSGRPTWTPL